MVNWNNYSDNYWNCIISNSGMIVFDKIYFAIIDDEKEKASRLFKRYKWILSKEDKEILNHKLIKLMFQTETNITKENNGNS